MPFMMHLEQEVSLAYKQIEMLLDDNCEFFIDFLKLLDEKYPEGDIIRIILDNHTVHVNKKARHFLLTFQGGSYMAEVFRSGLENVSTIQKESALALGMKKSQVLIHIILPQALANSIPAICANMIFLIKETSVFSAVALADLMFVTKDLIGIYYKTDEALFMLVIAYLVILLPVSLLCSLVERRIRYGEYGA